MLAALSVTCLFAETTVANAETKEQKAFFSTVPTSDNLKKMEPVNQDVKAWTIDQNGNKKFVTPMNLANTNDNMVSPMYVEGRLVYTFIRYDQNVTKSAMYQHFVSYVSLRNTTQDPIPLKYTQQNSTTNAWQVTGKVEAEAEFKTAMLAKLKASFGLSVSDTKTTYSSTNVEFTINIPVGKTGKISKYYAGKYSGGQSVWSVQDVIGGYPPFTYYEEASAWGIATNEVNYDAITY
jgi:hypothetical protein